MSLLKFSLELSKSGKNTVFTLEKNTVNTNYMWHFDHLPIMFVGSKRDAKEAVRTIMEVNSHFRLIEGHKEFTKVFADKLGERYTREKDKEDDKMHLQS